MLQLKEVAGAVEGRFMKMFNKVVIVAPV